MVSVNQAARRERLGGLLDRLAGNLLPQIEQTVTAGRLPPAQIYDLVQTGPNWKRSYETQTGLPLDGSSAIARDVRFGSPFTFRILAPDLLVNSILDGQQGNANPIDIIDTAQRADSSFAAYTSRLDDIRLGSFFLRNTSAFNLLENFVAEGQVFNPKNFNDPANVQPALADARSAADVILQLTKILSTPPLTLLINPQNMVINHQKKQNYSDRSRFNYIFQSWGEEQVKLSVSGVTGAFIAGAPPTQFFNGRGTRAQQVTDTPNPTGVQWAARRDSGAMQNLLNLLLFYRSNGYIYDTIGQSEAHHWIGSIAIDYDQWTYVGHFENFNYGFTEDKQHGMLEFSFEFTADRIFDSARRDFVVLPIESPVPSASDIQWQNPPASRREPGKGLFGPFDNLRRNFRSAPAPTSEGVTPPSLPPRAPNGRIVRANGPSGTVRGGDF